MKLTSLFLSIVIVLFAFSSCNNMQPEQRKFGFVRSGDLITQFDGYTKAQEKYKSELEKLNQEFEREKAKYAASTMDKAQVEQYLYGYSQQLQEKALKADQEMTQEVLDIINKKVEDYGSKNDYTMIFGTMTGGNILYADTILDLTDKILELLNNDYNGKTTNVTDTKTDTE